MRQMGLSTAAPRRQLVQLLAAASLLEAVAMRCACSA